MILESAAKQLPEARKKTKFRWPPVKRTQGAIQKVKGYVNMKNPETYRYIKSKTGLSLPTIGKIIHRLTV